MAVILSSWKVDNLELKGLHQPVVTSIYSTSSVPLFSFSVQSPMRIDIEGHTDAYVHTHIQLQCIYTYSTLYRSVLVLIDRWICNWKKKNQSFLGRIRHVGTVVLCRNQKYIYNENIYGHKNAQVFLCDDNDPSQTLTDHNVRLKNEVTAKILSDYQYQLNALLSLV